MTTVNVATEDILLIVAVGLDTIKEIRNEMLDENIARVLAEKVWSWRKLKRVPRCTTRAEAIEVLKDEGLEDFFGTSTYMQIMRYGVARKHEDRLKQLAKMAQASIDGVVSMNSEDVDLLRKYAPALHKLTEEPK